MSMVILMRGLSGVGKSTWALKNYPEAEVFSADRYHVNEQGEYQFNPERIQEAHNGCLLEFSKRVLTLSSLQVTNATLVVDNTNSRLWELAPYYRIAEAAGLKVLVVWLLICPKRAHARNRHGTPLEKVELMARSFDPLPQHWNVRIEEAYPDA